MHSDPPPALERLICDPLSEYERIALITNIAFARTETEVVERLAGADTQTIVDLIDEASIHIFSSPSG